MQISFLSSFQTRVSSIQWLVVLQVIGAAVGVACFVLAMYFLLKDRGLQASEGVTEQHKTQPASEELQIDSTRSQNNSPEKKAFVYVSGAVKNPGVYQLNLDSRINDVLNLAGGFEKTADSAAVAKQLNLAEKIQDGQHIHVPVRGEEESLALIENSSVIKTESSSQVNVNTAEPSQLKTLKGIGEARAQQIVQNRPYANYDEFATKSKLPSNVLSDIQSQIVFSTGTNL